MKFLTVINENDIKKAIQFGAQKHKGQVRKFDGKPYFGHPTRVAETIKKITKDKDVIIAAYLHDTVEDTETTVEELVKTFNKRVAALVKELTTVMGPADNKAEYLLKKMNSMSKEALLIKLADRLDNVSDFPTAPEKFVKKYSKETHYILDNLKTNLDGKHKKLINMIKEKLI